MTNPRARFWLGFDAPRASTADCYSRRVRESTFMLILPQDMGVWAHRTVCDARWDRCFGFAYLGHWGAPGQSVSARSSHIIPSHHALFIDDSRARIIEINCHGRNNGCGIGGELCLCYIDYVHNFPAIQRHNAYTKHTCWLHDKTPFTSNCSMLWVWCPYV